MKNDNIKHICNLTLAQQKEVTAELAAMLQRDRAKPVPRVCKPTKKN